MPAEVIRPKFDVVRGWPQGSAHDRTFESVVDGGGAPLKLRQGSFVTTTTNAGECKPATVGTGATALLPLWLVIEGNDESDSYAGDYLDKAVVIKGSFEVLLSETMFVANAYTPSDHLTIIGGQFAPANPGVNEGINAYVLSYDAASKLLRASVTL